jgi:hypothetical protein
LFSRPDKLTNLALIKVGQEAMFLDEAEHSELMKILPLKLRLFDGLCSSASLQDSDAPNFFIRVLMKIQNFLPRSTSF